MTTANLMNVSGVKGNFTAQAEASKKLQEENLEVAEMFAGLMNQTIGFSNSGETDLTSDETVSKAENSQSVKDSYQRYSYKDNQIESASEKSISEKVEESEEVLEQVEEDVVNTICEEYGVSEEEIKNLLDDMGLNVLDLLNPQNLVGFIVELTGVASNEELLMDQNFLQVMENLNHLAEGLMKELDVDVEGLQQIVDQMEVVDAEVELPEEVQEVIETLVENPEESLNVETVEHTETVSDVEKVEIAEKVAIETEIKDVEETVEVKTQETRQVEGETEQQMETPVEGIDTKETLSDNKNSEGNAFLNQNSNEAMVTNQTTTNVSQAVDVPQAQFSSYVSTDTMQIMEQIVQQMRVSVTPDVSSMEMQLNPENLGKVYVQISSEEGVVNAQFHATNEVVKEALETQIATLRENLNQAGVKVDAIEVTIASHEFERNLEQNHQNPEKQLEGQDVSSQRRRNISVDSLDELSGIMTEEETLVAQIMKDNGNSIDYTA